MLVLTALLEFETDPYKILREVDRIIVSGGYIIIAGYNPISLAFLGKLLPKYQSNPPWNGNFFMPSRVKDWLNLLGYQIYGDERCVYDHLLSSASCSSSIQIALEKWLPSTGSMYLIVAKKMDSPFTPIKDKQKVRAPNWSTAPTAGRAGMKVKNVSLKKT